MRADTAIGPYRTAAPLGPDVWSVDGPEPGREARRLDGRPSPDFDLVADRLTALRHPHLWPVLGAARIDGRAWIVRTPVEGGTLADRLAAGHRPPYKVAIDVGVAVLRALTHAHQAGFAHGSLDAGSVAWSDGLRLVGVGYGALVGRPADPADDVRAVIGLVRALVPDPPGELRALLASPLATADALCRALKTLDPALGQDRDFDFRPARPVESPPPPAAPPPPPAARPAPPPATRPTPPPDPAPQPPAPTTPGEDTWGVEAPTDEPPPPSRGAGWVVGSREMVEASTEDTWGVGEGPAPARSKTTSGALKRDHTGAIVHTLSTANRADAEKPARNPLSVAAVVIASLAVLLVGARVVLNQLADPEPEPAVLRPVLTPDSPTAAPSAVIPASEGVGDGGPGGGSPGDGGAPDASGPTVNLIIGPVDARVVRVSDKAVVCEAARACAVPIDIDYRVEAKGYESRSISGDDLYDRRHIGTLELVLQPVQPKSSKKKKRR